jgi:diguanylate cyclase (GGDEF)-like protein
VIDGLTHAARHAFEAAGALAVILLVLSLRRRHPKDFLDAWVFAATAAFVSSVAAAAAVFIDGSRLLLFLASLCFLAGAYLQGGWIAVATRGLARCRNLNRREVRLMSAVAAGLALVHALALLGASPSLRLLLEEGVANLVVGAGALTGGWWVWSQRYRRESTPFALFTFALWGYGSLQIAEFVAMLASPGRGLSAGFGVAELVFQGGIALGIAISLLEDEREAAVEAAAQVEHIAYHDLLTGLPNRALFFDRLVVAIGHANRNQQRLAVLFFDLDRFKVINDSLGHSIGDSLLKSVSNRIRDVLRRDDTLARFGGDEFVILTQISGNIEDAGKIARKTLDALSEPFLVGSREIVITSSIGVAVYPNDGTDAETIVKNADTAMYRAKEQGRDNYQFYTSSMNARALEMLEIENDLRRAVIRNELRLHYQPLIDVAADRVFGIEALLRWEHPERGLLLPDRFIATAESSGLIVPIGEWVLREACRQAKTWQRQFGNDLIVCVNLSARQFQQPNLSDQVRSALEQSGLRAKNLELEITESNAMKDVATTARVLAELKALGVRIAIDDFGTGYSSLSYLRQFPVDTLKLDQSFVREITVPEDGAIARGVIAMAHSLHLKVLAEGVETLGQLEFLRANACDRLQGYLFSRPLPPAMFEKFVSHQRRNGHIVQATAGEAKLRAAEKEKAPRSGAFDLLNPNRLTS